MHQPGEDRSSAKHLGPLSVAADASGREPSAGGSRTTMWRSFFLAAGIFSSMIGVEMLVIDSAVLMPIDGRGAPQNVAAPDWAPWTLLSVGAVTILHFSNLQAKSSATLPLKSSGVGHW